MYQLFYDDSTSPVSVCAGVKMAHALHLANLLSGSFNIFLIILTVISDILMVILIRNLRRTQPIQLVPWKSTKNEENKKEDISVPVRATSISLVITAITTSPRRSNQN